VSDDGAALIRLVDVHKRFGPHAVLRGISLDVRPRETVVVLGGSGSGKSVTLRLVIGLLAPDRGDVLVEGRSVPKLREDGLREIRRRVGFLFQSGALFDSMDVFENIAFPLREESWDESRVAARVAEVLELVDLDAKVGALDPSELSGGMRKRVALARSIAVAPRAMLYDEPTTGLDPVTSSAINELIRGLQSKLGMTSVVVTHDIRTAFEVGDRIAFLHKGKLRFVGTVDEARATTDEILAAFLAGRLPGGAHAR
jgi:phospholipid/cholesterol/gamma-HCH transport system ATP-binding protein